VSYYEVAVINYPGDKMLAKELRNARNKLEESQIEAVSHIKIGPTITEISTAEQFHEAISIPGKATNPGIRLLVFKRGQYTGSHTVGINSLVYTPFSPSKYCVLINANGFLYVPYSPNKLISIWNY
jgi:hypothetical protein